MYIFYDLETTGIDVVFDQILQFGAILTDENLVELDRFECRCRLLPWVVPAPRALLVTATDVSRLDDPTLPDFYAMMHEIANRLEQWGPATFVGYNSMRFDEPFLQRAFWQALLPPYLTVTGSNSRLDILPLVRAAVCFKPNVLTIPYREDGGLSFRLDALAPANGFNNHHAHDAIGDVEATLFLARKLKFGLPTLWEPLTSRTSKSAMTALVSLNEPLFLFHHGAAPTVACYQAINQSPLRSSHVTIARLGFNWLAARVAFEQNSAAMRRALRRVPLNKAPLLLTANETEVLAGTVPSDAELEQASFLRSESQFCLDLCELMHPHLHGPATAGAQVEELIFDGFAVPHDERLMTDFHQASYPDKLIIARSFKDSRFRRLAMRILFVQAPSILDIRDETNIKIGISQRLRGDTEGQHRWRSLSDAHKELDTFPESSLDSETQKIKGWLTSRGKLTN